MFQEFGFIKRMSFELTEIFENIELGIVLFQKNEIVFMN